MTVYSETKASKATNHHTGETVTNVMFDEFLLDDWPKQASKLLLFQLLDKFLPSGKPVTGASMSVACESENTDLSTSSQREPEAGLASAGLLRSETPLFGF